MIHSLSSNSAKLGGARRVNYAVVNAKLRRTLYSIVTPH